MESKHTPTPWELHDFEIVNEIKKGLVQAVPLYTVRIKGTLNPASDDWDQAQANAAFIVKCVNVHAELLALLKESLSFLESEFGGMGDADYTGVNLFKRIQRAIAKAEKP